MIEVTAAARGYIKDWLIENCAPYMWLSIKGGGCAGFEYDWKLLPDDSYEAMRMEDDEIISLGDGYRLIIDYMAIDYLRDVTIDYKEEFPVSGLVIQNPITTASCGCGKSVGF